MLNRQHLYVGHMFNDGVTILDAADPRRLKPVGFFTAGTNTRAPPAGVRRSHAPRERREHRRHAVMTTCAATSNALADSITNKKKFRSGLSIHDISKPADMREIAFSNSGLRHQPPVVDRRQRTGVHFDGYTDHVP
jgi:hypothetical protein